MQELTNDTNFFEFVKEKIKDRRNLGILGLIIIILLGLLVLFVKNTSNISHGVEVISSESNTPQPLETPNSIVAEISGAVVKPGVYSLTTGARINDLIENAGGLSVEADEQKTAKLLNRASLLQDGQKVYIPYKDEQTEVMSANIVSGGSVQTNAPLVSSQPTQTMSQSTININSASQKELESLWGIGPVTGKKIIDNRPYSDIVELLNKKIVKKNVYDRIHDQISVQ